LFVDPIDNTSIIEVLRRPVESAQYCSWVFGQRLRHAGLLGSMGTVGDALDNAVAESFFASLQCELLDRHQWHTRAELARAMFHYVEAFYNPLRRHSTLGYLSPIDYETAHAA
jgi:transposase InsO family protein